MADEGAGEPPTITLRSAVFLPLIARGQLTGLIYADIREVFGSFTSEDLDLLSVFANQAATAIENARWSSELEGRVVTRTAELSARTAELQAANQRLEQRNAELAIINRVSQAMSRQLDVDAIIKIVGDQVRDSFQVECTNIYLYNSLTNLISSPYYFDRGYLSMEPFPFGQGLTSTVIRTRQPLILGTREEMDQLMAVRFYIKPGDEELTQSYLGVPIIAGEQVIGVVSVQSYEPHAYENSHLNLLSTLAASLGVALVNARLFEETKRLLAEMEQRAAELETINRIGQALAAQLDLDRMIEFVGEQARATFAADIAYVALLDRTTNLIRFPYTFGEDLSPLPFGQGLTSRILETGEPLLLNQEVNAKREQMGVGLVGTAALSYLGVPIKVGQEAVGVISVQSIQAEGLFDEKDLRLLSTIAASVSAAFQNARLYGEIQRRAEEMATLAEISNDIAATHELQSVLEHIASRAKGLLQVRDIAISLFENDGEMLRPAVALGKYHQEILADSVRVGEGITGSVAQSGLAEILNFPEQDPRAHHVPGTPPNNEESEGMMIAPMVSHGQVTGLIIAWRERVDGLFKQAELNFLVSLARQAAIALENARLYIETERRADQMATVADVGREVSATLDLQAVLASIAGHVHSLFNAQDTIVRLIQPDGRTFQTVVALGKYAEQFQNSTVELGEGISGAIAQTGVAEVIADVSKDPRGLHVSGTPEEEDAPETMMCSPLIARDRTIGLISLYRAIQDGQFTQVDLDFLTGLARQAAIAVENARLFEAAQESQRRLSDIIDFLPDATLGVDRQGRVIAWNRAIEEMTGVKAADILGKGDYEYALPFYGERRPILIDLVLLPDGEIEQKYAHLQRQGKILVGEAHVPLLQGRPAYLYATASALRNSKGEVVGAIETIRDTSDRKRAEQELEQARAEAEAARQLAETANQAKSAFLAMMSHEIRTPMNAIIGMSGLLMDTPLNPDQRDFAETIRSSGDALLTIINDILDFSKIEAGKMSLEEQPFELRECIEASLDLIKVRAGEKGLELA
jgi:PAS domain S-box-containing protein